MIVTVLGPNGINDATFHVHSKGCRDIARYGRMDAWDVDVSTEQELVECAFDDFIGTDETCYDGVYTTWEDYVHELRFFPCVKGLW